MIANDNLAAEAAAAAEHHVAENTSEIQAQALTMAILHKRGEELRSIGMGFKAEGSLDIDNKLFDAAGLIYQVVIDMGHDITRKKGIR
jgi:hypothetical protein